MKWYKVSGAIAVPIVVALAVGCNEQSTGPDVTGVGLLEVWLNVTGDTPDPDGFTVSLDDVLRERIPAGERVQFAELDAGNHTVMLGSVESFCSLSGENPQTVTVAANETTAASFNVVCGSDSVSADVAGMDIFGAGYNGFGNYADVFEVRGHVLDVELLSKEGLVERVQYERATFQVVSGNDANSYAANLALQVDVEGSASTIAGTFSGAAGANFSSERLTRGEYSFATAQSLIRKHGLRVPFHITADELKPFLTVPARDAINDPDVDPAELFAVFGTHVLRGMIVGGRLDYSVSASMVFETGSRDIGAYARASYEGAFGSASAAVEMQSQLSWENYKQTEERHLEVYGGNSEYGQFIFNDQDYRDWVFSIDGNPGFMAFERSGLVGIWRLAEDEARKDELRAYYLEKGGTEHAWDIEHASHFGSDFEAGTEGWAIGGCGGPIDPQLRRGFGYFGSYIWTEDCSMDPRGTYFAAPELFRGDKSAFFKGTFSYVIWIPAWQFGGFSNNNIDGDYTHHYDWPILEIYSPNGNLYFFVDHFLDQTYIPPKPWLSPENVVEEKPIHVQIPLNAESCNTTPGEFHCWMKRQVHQYVPASDDDIWAALNNIAFIEIQGDYLDTNEFLALDRVKMSVAAENENP